MSGDARRATFFFSAISAIGLIVGFVAASFALSATQDNPGASGRQGNAQLRGVLFAEPYPHLRLPPSAEFPAGRTVTVASSNGKRGVQRFARDLDGKIVDARGFILQRGDGEMLQTQRRLAESEDQTPIDLTPVEDLGRWRLAGEICDGQCVLGIMRPGRGLAHKACANLCIKGGVPPLFVTEAPVEGSQYMLIAGPDGGPAPAELFDLTAQFIQVEGALERRGSLLVFKMDFETVEKL